MHNLFLSPSKIWEKMSGVTTKSSKKIMYAPILILFSGNGVWCLLVSLTITCLRCLCLKGFFTAIVNTKVYRYNELRSELVHRTYNSYNERGSELVRNELTTRKHIGVSRQFHCSCLGALTLHVRNLGVCEGHFALCHLALDGSYIRLSRLTRCMPTGVLGGQTENER
jgi:hypothetical protein